MYSSKFERMIRLWMIAKHMLVVIAHDNARLFGEQSFFQITKKLEVNSYRIN